MTRSGTVRVAADDRIPWYLIGLGSLLILVQAAEISYMYAAGMDLLYTGSFLVGMVTGVPFIGGVIYGGFWLRRSALDPSRYRRIAGWSLAGLAAFGAINLATMATMPDVTDMARFGWARWAVSLGAGSGLLIGAIEGRTIERALAAERSALRSEHLEAQRDVLDYLNSVLRHEVLNAATIINGYASNLLEEDRGLDEDVLRWAEIIASESAEMTNVIEDVRVLLHATDGAVRFECVEISGILAHEVDRLRHTFGEVETDLSAPEAVHVRADDLLPRVFANLLSNAVEHNDSAVARVAIDVTTTADRVRIEIEDNGPGIPEREHEQLFERSEARGSTHGLGLYLVGKLVDRYDGTIELTETGPDGSLFTIELPRADASVDGRPAGERVAPPSLAAE